MKAFLKFTCLKGLAFVVIMRHAGVAKAASRAGPAPSATGRPKQCAGTPCQGGSKHIQILISIIHMMEQYDLKLCQQ